VRKGIHRAWKRWQIICPEPRYLHFLAVALPKCSITTHTKMWSGKRLCSCLYIFCCTPHVSRHHSM
jgi:hypothetical protein